MPRIIVTTDLAEDVTSPGGAAVLLDERVDSAHLSVGDTASRLLERVGWAILDAEERHGARFDRTRPGSLRAPSRPARRGRPIAA